MTWVLEVDFFCFFWGVTSVTWGLGGMCFVFGWGWVCCFFFCLVCFLGEMFFFFWGGGLVGFVSFWLVFFGGWVCWEGQEDLGFLFGGFKKTYGFWRSLQKTFSVGRLKPDSNFAVGKSLPVVSCFCFFRLNLILVTKLHYFCRKYGSFSVEDFVAALA